jgi:hypothetical protein
VGGDDGVDEGVSGCVSIGDGEGWFVLLLCCLRHDEDGVWMVQLEKFPFLFFTISTDNQGSSAFIACLDVQRASASWDMKDLCV